jgi:hypothetical protein
MGFFFFLISSFFYSWRGKGGMGFTFSLFVSFFNSWRWKGGMGFFFFFFYTWMGEKAMGLFIYNSVFVNFLLLFSLDLLEVYGFMPWIFVCRNFF